MKKYKLLKKDCVLQGDTKLYRIKALRSFSDVNKGDLGGYVETEHNLSHNGSAWVYNNAKIFGEAWVYGDGMVFDDVLVFGEALIFGNTKIFGDALVFGDALTTHIIKRRQRNEKYNIL